MGLIGGAALHARTFGGGLASGGSGMGGGFIEGDVADLARRVINGEFGNGDARRAAVLETLLCPPQ